MPPRPKYDYKSSSSLRIDCCDCFLAVTFHCIGTQLSTSCINISTMLLTNNTVDSLFLKRIIKGQDALFGTTTILVMLTNWVVRNQVYKDNFLMFLSNSANSKACSTPSLTSLSMMYSKVTRRLVVSI